MTEELVLPLNNKQRKTWRYFAMIVPPLMLAAFVGPWVVDGTGPEGLRAMVEAGFGWLFVLALPPLLFAYLALVNLTDRLVFTQTHLERRGLWNPSIYRGPVAYTDLVRVRVGGFGLLLIETSSGKTFRLFPKAYEGGPEAVLSMLRERLPQDHFEADLERRLETRTRRDRLLPWLPVAAAWLVAAGGLIDPAIDLLKKNRAWTLEIDARSMDQAIEDFALTPDGMLWLLVRYRRTDILDSASYAVRSMSAEGDQIWEIPAMDDLFPEGVPDFSIPFPTALRLTPAGEPRVEFGLEVLALQLPSGNWGWQSAEASTPFAELTEWTGDPYWARLQAEGTILVRDPQTGGVLEVWLAGEGRSFSLDYEMLPSGDLLARIVTGDERNFLAHVPGTEQKLIWVEVDLAPFRALGYWKLVDYATDTASRLYVLVQDERYCASGHPASSLGLVNAPGEAWRWWTLTQPGECRNVLGEGQLVVDALGRIWVSNLRVLTVLPLDSLSTGATVEAVHYSEDNSGYMAGRKLEPGPDGRIWSLDLLGHGLVWADTKSEELGEPLPEWIAVLRRETRWKFAPGVAGLILFIGTAIWNRSVASRQRRWRN